MSAISAYDMKGEIKYIVSGDDVVIQTTLENSKDHFIDGSWEPDLFYVKDGQPIERPANTATLDGLVLHNLPTPCKMFINETEYHVEDSTVELELPMSAKYRIIIVAFPFLDAEFEIET